MQIIEGWLCARAQAKRGDKVVDGKLVSDAVMDRTLDTLRGLLLAGVTSDSAPPYAASTTSSSYV